MQSLTSREITTSCSQKRRRKRNVELTYTSIKLLKKLQKIDRLCDRYYKLPVIEWAGEQEPTPQKPQKTQSTSRKANIVKPVIKSLKARLENTSNINVQYPESSRFRTRDSTLGPGKYSPSQASSSPTWKFSSVPRMDNPFTHKLKCISMNHPKKLPPINNSVCNEPLNFEFSVTN